jgi:putative tryptophan/tyrosine transport system substrate-binding protein
MRRVVRDSGRVALSVYSPIERTPGANTFVRALDEVLSREFIRLLGGALAAQAIPANAQELRVRTVGVLIGLANDAEAKARTEAFQQGLEREGCSLGQNLRIEYRYAEGDSVRMQALAKEVVELKPHCILAHSTPVVAALMQATQTIPIVFVSIADPVGSGFVASMARPDGNMTGFTIFPATITSKYLSMLKEIVPQLVRVAIIYNPDSAPAADTFFLTPFTDAAQAPTKFELVINLRTAKALGLVIPRILLSGADQVIE